MEPQTLVRFALAAVAIAGARRCPALLPSAATLAALACLDVGSVSGSLPLRAGIAVLWPGVALAGMAWGLRQGEAPSMLPRLLVHRIVRLFDRLRLGHVAPREGAPADDEQPLVEEGHPPTLPAAILLGYLLAALAVAVTYGPAHGVYLAALPASRLVALAAVVALLLRRRPSTWAQVAACVPAIGLAVGVVVGVWPLWQAGHEAVRAGWGLARLETWVSMAATACAIGLAWRGERVR